MSDGYYDFDGHPIQEPRCCGRGLYARGTAGKGNGNVMACGGCHRDVCIKNGSDERRSLAEYETKLEKFRHG